MAQESLQELILRREKARLDREKNQVAGSPKAAPFTTEKPVELKPELTGSLFKSKPIQDPEKLKGIVNRREASRNLFPRKSSISNPDGTRSSERSITVNVQELNRGRATNIPTIFGGKQRTEEEAIRRIMESGGVDPETGRRLPGFNSVEEAVQAAGVRSNALGRLRDKEDSGKIARDIIERREAIRKGLAVPYRPRRFNAQDPESVQEHQLIAKDFEVSDYPKEFDKVKGDTFSDRIKSILPEQKVSERNAKMNRPWQVDLQEEMDALYQDLAEKYPGQVIFKPGESPMDRRGQKWRDDLFGSKKEAAKRQQEIEISKIRHVGSSVALGFVDMFASVPEYIAEAAKYLEESTGLFVRDEEIEDRALFQLGQAMRKYARELFPQNEELADSFLLTVLPQGAGSLAAFYAFGAIGAIARLPGYIIPMMAGVASSSASLYNEAKAYGATDDEAFGAWMGGHLSGAMEGLPIGRALSRFDKASGGGIKKILASGFKGGLEEMVQEVAQTVTENITAQMTFDEKREWNAGIYESGGAGGILGAGANMLLAAAGMRTRHLPGGKVDPKKEAAYYEQEDKFKESLRDPSIPKEEKEKAFKKFQEGTKEIYGLTEDEKAAGITIEKKAEVAKGKIKAEAEELAGRRPETKDPTEKDVVEVVDVDKRSDAPQQEKKVSYAVATKAIKKHIESLKEEPDIDRIRQAGAGLLPDEEVGPPTEQTPDVAQAPAAAEEGVAQQTPEQVDQETKEILDSSEQVQVDRMVSEAFQSARELPENQGQRILGNAKNEIQTKIDGLLDGIRANEPLDVNKERLLGHLRDSLLSVDARIEELFVQGKQEGEGEQALIDRANRVLIEARTAESVEGSDLMGPFRAVGEIVGQMQDQIVRQKYKSSPEFGEALKKLEDIEERMDQGFVEQQEATSPEETQKEASDRSDRALALEESEKIKPVNKIFSNHDAVEGKKIKGGAAFPAFGPMTYRVENAAGEVIGSIKKAPSGDWVVSIKREDAVVSEKSFKGFTQARKYAKEAESEGEFLYHGSSAEGAAVINENGYLGYSKRPTYVTIRRTEAEMYAKSYGGEVFKIKRSDFNKEFENTDHLEEIAEQGVTTIPDWTGQKIPIVKETSLEISQRIARNTLEKGLINKEEEKKRKAKREAQVKKNQTEVVNKRRHILMPDGTVREARRGEWKKILEKGVAGKNIEQVLNANSREVKKYENNPPEGYKDISEWKVKEFQTALDLLNQESKDAGIYTEDEFLLTGRQENERPRHVEVFKFYDIDTVEYNIAMSGGIGMERKADGTLTEEWRRLLLQDGPKEESYLDPIYDKGASPEAISEVEERLISESILAPTDDLESILQGRARVKKGEGLRGYPTLEARDRMEFEGGREQAEQEAVEAEEVKRQEGEMTDARIAAEEAGIDVELFEDSIQIYLQSIDMPAARAVEVLRETEEKLTAAVDSGQEQMKGPRDSVREMIAEREGETVEGAKGGTVGGYYPKRPVQRTIDGAEEFQAESRLNDDEAKLKTIQNVKPHATAMGERAMRELGAREKELIESIAEQKKEVGRKEGKGQADMFGEKPSETEEAEGAGGRPGQYVPRFIPGTPVTPPPTPPPGAPKEKAAPPPPPPPPGPPEDKRDPYDKAFEAQIAPEDIEGNETEEEKLTLDQRVRKMLTTLQTAVTSQYTPLREAQKDLYKRLDQVMPTMDAARKAELLAGTDGLAWADFLDYRKDVIDHIGKEDYRAFNTYLFLKRTHQRLEDDPIKKKVGDWTVEEAKKGLDTQADRLGKAKIKHFEQIASKYQRHTDRLLKSLVKSGILSPDQYNAIKEHNDFYALFKVAKHYRDWDMKLENAGGRITNDFKLLHAITGLEESDVQVVDIVGETAKAIYNTRIRAEKNLFKMYLWDMADMDHDSKFFQRGRVDEYYPIEIKPIQEVLEQFRLQHMANNWQPIEAQMIKVGKMIELAEKMGITVDKGRLRSSLGRAEIGGAEMTDAELKIRAFVSEVAAHEMAHMVDISQKDQLGQPVTKTRKVFGVEREILQRLSSLINTKKVFRNELKGLVDFTGLGGSPAYRNSAKEKWAEFLNLYIHNPAKAKELAPKWTLYFETKLLPVKEVTKLVEGLSGFYQGIDELPNIMSDLGKFDKGGPGGSYLERALLAAFPDKASHLGVNFGTKVPDGFKRVLLRVEGKQKALDVRADIYESIEGLTSYQGAVVTNFFAKAGSLLRGGATVYNATFMVKNAFFRDPVRLALLSKYGLNLTKFTKENLHEIIRFPLDWVDAIRSAMTGNFSTPDDLYMKWLRSGAGFTDISSLLMPQSLVLEEKSNKNLINKLGNPIARFASALEQSTKLLGFKRALRLEKFDTLTPEAQKYKMEEIASEIRRYSGSPDFWRHGLKIKGNWSMIFMFLNARIQGVSADLSRLGGKEGYTKEAWGNLAVGVGIPTLALAALNYLDDEDREYFEKQNAVERHNYYMVPRGIYYLDDNGEKRQEYWTIPKDDTAKIFSAMIENFVKFSLDHDPVVAREFLTDFVQDISPITMSGETGSEVMESVFSSLNPILKTPAEFAFGRNTYYHTDIIPSKMKDWNPEDQKRSTTPGVFVSAGKVLGVSPLVLEHLTRNITASGLTQFLTRKAQPGREGWTAWPVLKMFASSPYGGLDGRLERLMAVREGAGEEKGSRYWEVEAKWIELKDLDRAGYSKRIREIAAEGDKELVRKIREKKKKSDIGWNYIDGMTQNLGVSNGARAKFIFQELKTMRNKEERDAYLRDLRKKRILTTAVRRQLTRMRRAEEENE